MRVELYGALLSTLIGGSAAAQVPPEVGAVGTVRMTGRAIAGALACGVPRDRVLAVGRRAVEQAHLSAPNIPVEQLAHYQLDAIETAQREDGQMGDDRCRTALESYRHVEDLFTAVR